MPSSYFLSLVRALVPCTAAALLVASGTRQALAAEQAAFVRVSPRDPRYLELSDGRPYIPIGLNLIHPSGRAGGNEAEGLRQMDEWMQKLARHGGNYVRVWISSPFWDIESQRSGEYDEAKARRLDAMLASARRHGLRVKMTLEHFRSLAGQPRQGWAHKPLHHVAQGGTATNLADFFAGELSRNRFKRKLEWLAQRYADNPTIFGWELWNEVNAVATSAEYYMPWTETMLAELHRLFPRNLALQSLGSYDTARVRELYCRHSLLPGNDVAQVHRYLDLGASLEVCRGPVDVLAADAVRAILACRPQRPVILAESGAVEPRHTGPFKLYAKDRAGIILHDVLFAPFFAGAAGAGQCWHWGEYVDRNDLWHQFGRFAEAVKNVDPAAEGFHPIEIEHARLRIYALVGKNSALCWCRDSRNSWRTELEEGRAPESVTDASIDLPQLPASPGGRRVEFYDPWANRWSRGARAEGKLRLPEFQRSLVVRVSR